MSLEYQMGFMSKIDDILCLEISNVWSFCNSLRPHDDQKKNVAP